MFSTTTHDGRQQSEGDGCRSTTDMMYTTTTVRGKALLPVALNDMEDLLASIRWDGWSGFDSPLTHPFTYFALTHGVHRNAIAELKSDY